MNAERLQKLITDVLALEKKSKVQEALTSLQQAFQTLVQQPQDANIQTDLATKLTGLEEAITSLFGNLTPVELENLKNIGAKDYFSPTLVEGIRKNISENSITPAITQKYIDKLVSKRQAYLDTLGALTKGLTDVGVKPVSLSPGEAEIGFLIPRSLFDNNLGSLAKELAIIDRIVKIFAEAIGRDTKQVEVRTISTSDPLFFFGYDVTTILIIGASITWLLTTYRQILDLKSLRNKAADMGFKDNELKVFDEKVATAIDKSVAERIGQIIDGKKATPRQNELKNGLDWALRSLMARIERGMTVEPRGIEPPAGADGAVHADAESFEKLREVTQGLEFPAIEGQPILTIPGPPPDDAAKESRKAKRAETGKQIS